MSRELATLDVEPDQLGEVVVDRRTGTVLLPSGAVVASPVVVRVAGLPAGVLENLRFEESFSLACAVTETVQGLRIQAQALSDDLFVAIGNCPSGVEKGALVGLRRSVFQLRAPKAREWNEQVAALVPAELAERLRGWTSELDRARRLSAELPEMLARETVAKQDVLREVVDHPWFRHALSLASPALSGETAKWLADESHLPRRATVVRLAKYVARAAAKTSPYSTFTVSGWASWSADGPAIRFSQPTAAVGVLELSGFLQGRLLASLREDPRLAATLPLRLNPSATCVDGTVRFLGPPPDESIVSVPAAPAVLECLRLLDGGASCDRAELRVALGGGDAGDPRIDRLIDRLIEAGLLERPLLVADLTPDPFAEVSAWLTSRGAAELGGALSDVRSQLRRTVPVGSPTGPAVARQEALAAAVDALGERVGLPVRRLMDRQVDLWHENAVFTEQVAELSATAWQPALADLDVVRRLVAALDRALPLRVALGEYCAARFGPGARVPFLTLHEAIARDLAAGVPSEEGPVADEMVDWLRPQGSASRPSLSNSRLTRLRELARIRQELQEALPTADSDGVIRADPVALAELAATWPEWITAPDSIACYLQLIPDGDSPGVVVNAAHGGHGRGRSRALHLIRQAGGEAPYEGSAAAGGPATAEFGALFGFAPNVRLASASYELDYPFAVSGRPEDERLPLRDLTVRHDPATGLASLFGPDPTTPIKALHLGMLADFLLPPAARLLTQAFGCGYLIHAGVPMFADATLAAPTPTVARLARLEIGRVVVRRARWVAPAAQVPVRAKGEPDAGYLVRIVEWLSANGIPSRCFVRTNDGPLTDGAGGEPRFDKSRKPVYVDFANWFLVQAFERMLADAGPVVVFDEVLPVLADAPGPQHRPAAVTELLVEISAGRNGDG